MTNSDLLDLQGRTALVTGAGQVGRSVATMLASHGARRVVVTDLYQAPLDAAADAVRDAGAEPVPVIADVTEQSSVAHLLEITQRLDQPVQILVNNAGLPPGYFDGGAGIKLFVDTSPDDWEPVIRLNLYGVMYMSHAFVPGMLAAGWGRVVTVVSDAGRTGDARMAAYAAAKAGSAGFMRTLATEVGRHGVTANCISLGTLWRDEAAPTEDQLKRISRSYPVGRPGYPHDVAALVQFLASEAAGWITGQVYPLNGGYSYAL